MRHIATMTIIFAATLAGCTPLPADYPGVVSEANGQMVVIEAVFTMDKKPSAAMQARADKICDGPSTFEGTRMPNRNAPNAPMLPGVTAANSQQLSFIFICG